MTQSTSGFWKHDDLLVVDRRQPLSSDRCVWTNEPANGQRSEIEFGGPTEAHTYERFKLAVPTSEKWKGSAQMAKRRIGKLIFRPAATACVVGILLLVVVLSFMDQTKPVGIAMIGIGMAGAFVGAIIAVIGLCWPHLDGVPGSGGTISAERVDPGQLFVRGAHPEFLAALPQWQGPSPNRAPAYIQWHFAYVTAAVGAFLLLGGAISLLFFGWSWWGAAGSRNWPTASGMIVQSVVEESQVVSRRGMQPVQSANISFAYSVGDERYTSRRVSYLGAPAGSAADAVSNYPAGAKVQVYYRPSDPAYGILEPGADAVMKVFTIGGLLCMLLSVPIIWLARKQFRQLKRMQQLAELAAGRH